MRDLQRGEAKDLEFTAVLRYYLLVRIFKNTWFTRFAEKEGITNGELWELVNQLEMGQAEANLGGDVYKVRVARQGEGKSGGYRVIVFFRSEERAFFIYGFAKSVRDNIDQGELKAFKEDAKYQLGLTDLQIETWLRRRDLIEIL
jgi:hypothetical protein